MFNGTVLYFQLPKSGASIAVEAPEGSRFQNKQLSLEIKVLQEMLLDGQKESFASYWSG